VPALGLVGCLLLGGCSARSGGPPAAARTTGGPKAPTSAESAAQATMTAVSAAVLTDDRASFAARISARDPAFQRTSDMLFDNLTDLPLRLLTFTVSPRNAALTSQRRTLLGSQARVEEVAVSWQLGGDAFPAEHTLWITFVPEAGTTKIAGTTDGVSDSTAQPLWWLEPVRSSVSGRTTLVAASGTDEDLWTRRATAAGATVRRQLHSGLGRHWSGQLIVEVPSDGQTFERVLGVKPGSYRQIAAVAWPEGSNPDRAALRIVVNPDLVQQLDGQGLAVLLTHEATHIATRSALSPAPTWLVEGFADYVAYDAYPGTAGVAAAALLAKVKSSGVPRALPRDGDFSPTARGLRLTYAESWLACRFLADRFSADRLTRFYSRVDAGMPVNQALSSVFGLDNTQFIKQWDRYLRARAHKKT
jgi:hypothetical protein